jgi:uncharacterized membrane-anchored protein
MKKILLSLSAAIVFQFIVLSGMYVSAAMPLWTGTEIKVKTIPIDPRSMFRGNYALLDYKFSLIETKHLPDNQELRNGEIIYVLLKPGKNGLYEFSKALLEPPAAGTFLRGRIENRSYEDGATFFRLKFGIEAFFAPKVKALALEKDLRDGGVAVLMVSAKGKARLKDIE